MDSGGNRKRAYRGRDRAVNHEMMPKKYPMLTDGEEDTNGNVESVKSQGMKTNGRGESCLGSFTSLPSRFRLVRYLPLPPTLSLFRSLVSLPLTDDKSE